MSSPVIGEVARAALQRQRYVVFRLGSLHSCSAFAIRISRSSIAAIWLFNAST
jgi:hypothetical protein